MCRAPVPEGSSVDAQAFSVFFLRSVVHAVPSFLLRVVYKAAVVARAANRRRDDVREMPHLPRDAHVDPAGVSVLSNTASLHSTAIVEFVAARMRACSSLNVLLLLECWRATSSVNLNPLSTRLMQLSSIMEQPV